MFMNGSSWSRQRRLKENIGKNIPTQEKIIQLGNSFDQLQHKILFFLLYLTAGRISEVMALKRDNFQFVVRNNRPIMLIDMPNRKHKKRKTKTLGIPLDAETDITKPVAEYITHGVGELFTFRSVRRAEQILEKIDMNPHWIRHIRLTHLLTIYDFKETQQQFYAGWTDTRPAAIYTELDWYDLTKKIKDIRA